MGLLANPAMPGKCRQKWMCDCCLRLY